MAAPVTPFSGPVFRILLLQACIRNTCLLFLLLLPVISLPGYSRTQSLIHRQGQLVQSRFPQQRVLKTFAVQAASVPAIQAKQQFVPEASTGPAAQFLAPQGQWGKESSSLTRGQQAGLPIELLLVGVGLLLGGVVAYGLQRARLTPLRQVSHYLEEVSLGKLPPPLPASRDEVGSMNQSINRLVEHLKASAAFAVQVGQGKYDTPFSPASREDTLGQALLSMQQRLRRSEQEDQKRNWTSEGLSRLGEALRTQGEVNALCEVFLSNVVHYLGANQGGIFIVEQPAGSPPVLQLAACYAYERKKFLTKTIQVGEGLVGQCYQEGETLYLTDIPPEYVKITSGLGGATPRSLVLVPLKMNDKREGVLEIVSFAPFEPYQLAFLEKLAGSLATTVAAVKVNQQTKQLLAISQQQAEQMRAAEEELRQNLEELEATQEEMRRKSEAMEGLLQEAQTRETLLQERENTLRESIEQLRAVEAEIGRKSAQLESQAMAVDLALATVEFTPGGEIIRANEHFLSLLNYRQEEILGRHHQQFLESDYTHSAAYQERWLSLLAGEAQTGEIKCQHQSGETRWFQAYYTPAYDALGQLDKILLLAQDITASKQLEAQLAQQQAELACVLAESESMLAETSTQTSILNQVAIISKTDLEGNITYVNEEFLKWSKYSPEEVLGQSHRCLKSGDQPDELFVTLWKTISSGKIFRGEIKNRAKDGSCYWVDAIIAPIVDQEGNPREYIAQGLVINHVKEKEARLEQLLAQLKVQGEGLQEALRQHQQHPE